MIWNNERDRDIEEYKRIMPECTESNDDDYEDKSNVGAIICLVCAVITMFVSIGCEFYL